MQGECNEYADFLRTEIFGPLGMNESGGDHPIQVLTNRASGYERDEDGTLRNAPSISMPILTGGGNLYSTVQDLAKWDEALAAQRLVSDEAYAAMYRPEREEYAYGWRIRQIDGRDVLAHSGGVPGFNAFNLRIPSESLHVVVLTNATPGNAGRIALALARSVLRPGPSPGGGF